MKVIGVAVVLLLFSAVWLRAADDGLVAHYNFDEGSGKTLRDTSGHKLHGQINGARYVKRGQGHALSFDGIDDFVDCGERPEFDLTDALTVEAWVHPDRPTSGEPGIFGKHFENFLLTLYQDGKAYWYIGHGGNNAHAVIGIGAWQHIAGTFDGKTIRLYVNGQLAKASASKFEKTNAGNRFTIGCVFGDPNNPDPAQISTQFFPGMVDEMRIYRRALSDAEIKARYDADFPQFGHADHSPVAAGTTVELGKLTITAGPDGRVQIDTGERQYTLDSYFSHPGKIIGWNSWATDATDAEKVWKPTVQRVNDSTLRITGQGAHYTIERTLKIEGDVIRAMDSITNITKEPIGVLIRSSFTTADAFAETIAPGGVENPSIYLRSDDDRIALLVEDDIGRHRYDAAVGLPTNQVSIRYTDLAIDAGKSQILEWSFYALGHEGTYFDFVNRLRREWNSNQPIDGIFEFFDIVANQSLLNDPKQLRAFLDRKPLGLVALVPWLDYDSQTVPYVWSRQQFKEKMQAAAKVFREVAPEAKLIGCIETDWVTIYPEKMKNGEKLPAWSPGSGGGPYRLNAEQTAIVDAAKLPFMNAAKRAADGTLMLEIYGRGGKPQTALWVYPAIGNAQHEFLMDQVKFLIDDVGLDGFYIDEFNQAWSKNHRTYDGWDGISAEIDPLTGKIRHKFIDCGLAGIESRVTLCNYALNKGKVVVANTWATSRVEQSMPVSRFAETWTNFDPFSFPDGGKPPMVMEVFRGALHTPVGLGINSSPDPNRIVTWVQKAMMTYLRHGALYYHYVVQPIPPEQGDYGIINHQYPITPIELGEGFIIGKERILTGVSLQTTWEKQVTPEVLCFDLNGRSVDTGDRVRIRPAGEGKYDIQIKLKDWQEFVVVK